ncbi:MAG: dephospho-CoA kinase [Mucispirillum sp.]|nr:dephospho-CoA kinase [Mucispirillum sp.]
MMRNIGMTGGIGCGKNKVAEMFNQLGFYTIDSDVSSRKVMEKGEPAYEKIVSVFGESILDEQGNILRKKLGHIVFNNKEKLKMLENIVHPAIYKYEKKERSKIFGRNDKAVVITHAALIIESKSIDKYDALIVISCPDELQIKRVMQRDNFSEEKARNIVSHQMPNEERLKYADFIIDNSSTLDDLYNEVKRVHNLIMQINYGEKHN